MGAGRRRRRREEEEEEGMFNGYITV